ncbi:helix-turn-helix transcriptional regulator [Bacillus subtilis]|uniref:helix-turn-helix domain-containing protein n=1 Tax=Bacillus subtilis TaxID=1423 RepID=UPI002DB76FF5|nr:helix-turn-helix transcriptional regulator [Bacillus subtilis]MEC3651383.1 helix-turn-helix transcriptional regulator [Bacillus subtilis]
MSLGSRVKLLRKKRGYTQQQLADHLDMGRSNFGHIENDRVKPTSDDLQKLAEILNTTTDYLLTGYESNEDDLDPEIRAIQRAAKKMNPEDRKKMVGAMKALFKEAFKEDE